MLDKTPEEIADELMKEYRAGAKVYDFESGEQIDQEKIEALAKLSPLEYDKQRAKAAKELNVRTTTLDKLVAERRPETESAGQGRAVKIPDVDLWHEPVDGDELVTALCSHIHKYVVLGVHQATAMAFWILHTWLLDQFRISPRLGITSPTKGCGKTTVLELLSMLVKRPKQAGSISPPALFRAIEQFQPTMLLDENEKYMEAGSDYHALLNEGHRRGATVLRVLGEKLELREFSVFGPVAYAHNGKIPDDLQQRSIINELQRRRADEPVSELQLGCYADLEQTAQMCARWADDHRLDIKAMPDMDGLINRVADNWRPLFAIADVVGGDWPDKVRAAAKAMTPLEADSIGTTLLVDTMAIFDQQSGEWADRMFSETLAEALAAIEGRPWAEWGRAKKPITKNQLAQLLHGFHVTPQTVRIGSKSLKGYKRHQFDAVWQRYLPQGVSETSQRHNLTAPDTSTPFQNVTADNDVTFQKCEQPLSPNDCDVVTFQKGSNAPDEGPGRVCAQCGAN